MKKLCLVFTLTLVLVFTGCAAHRIQTDPAVSAAPVSTWEQVNYNNLQVASRNRAVGEMVITAYKSGFLEKQYFDTLSREQINITRVHAKLSLLLKNLDTATGNAALVKQYLYAILGSAGVLAAAAGVKNTSTQQQIAQKVQLLVNSITNITGLLHTAGVKGF